MSDRFYVYILSCNDGTYYVGHTDNIENRINEHHTGICKGYTSSRRPVKLVWLSDFQSRNEAKQIEYKIKKWSSKKKEALIKQDWQLISKLAKKIFN